ncbi:MAG: hypothetical protein ACE5GE_14310 [Phycisphaerae bacterium]
MSQLVNCGFSCPPLPPVTVSFSGLAFFAIVAWLALLDFQSLVDGVGNIFTASSKFTPPLPRFCFVARLSAPR